VQYQTLKPDRILETQRRLTDRIAARFPTSGLREVAVELAGIVAKAAVRAEWIRRPIWPLRAGVAALALGGLAVGVWLAVSLRLQTDLRDALSFYHIAEAALHTGLFVAAVILFLVTLEIRLKRRRALDALHELRAIAHVIDMHQVAKEPEGLLRARPGDPEAAKQTTKTLDDLNRYLNYCIELLAIVSKVAALYVQDFPDGPTVAAVDQVENLCSGLSQKIWQKLTVLDECRDQKPEGPAA
jgi:hypothetical protein